MSIAGAIVATALAVFPGADAAAQTQSTPMDCNVGPLKRSYGGSEWGIYSCHDHKTLILYSIAGTPAAEFFFMFFRDEKGLHLYGEGIGDKQATLRAKEELSKLTIDDVDALIEETKTVTPAPAETGASDQPNRSRQP